MVISTRHLLLGLSCIVFMLGVGQWLFLPDKIMGAVAMACGLLSGVIVIVVVHSPIPTSNIEPQEMSEMPIKRRHELLRGTSMQLKEMKYRYSVRIDHNETADRCCFNTDVNTIKLGFVPVVVTDNATDKQSFGYVAFVYDGNRWKGPGLPCPGPREQAIAHALKNVDPMESEQEGDEFKDE